MGNEVLTGCHNRWDPSVCLTYCVHPENPKCEEFGHRRAVSNGPAMLSLSREDVALSDHHSRTELVDEVRPCWVETTLNLSPRSCSTRESCSAKPSPRTDYMFEHSNASTADTTFSKDVCHRPLVGHTISGHLFGDIADRNPPVNAGAVIPEEIGGKNFSTASELLSDMIDVNVEVLDVTVVTATATAVAKVATTHETPKGASELVQNNLDMLSTPPLIFDEVITFDDMFDESSESSVVTFAGFIEDGMPLRDCLP